MYWTGILALSVATFSLACAEPVFDDELGVTPVATEPGALEGTFAHKSTVLTLNEFPVFGEQLAGSEMYYLMERTWLPAEGTYELKATTCDGKMFDTIGGSSFIDRAAWQTNRQQGPVILELDHALGTYDIHEYSEAWSIELDDVRDDPFPADQEAALADDRIFDADDDGNPGATLHVEGFASGDVFFTQRRFGQFTGAVMSEDEIVGINSFDKNQMVLGATNDLLNDQLPQRRHPDPLESWFQEIRVDDGSGCDEVIDAVEDRRLAQLRPFNRE
jgi:hypothetical protein